MTQHLRTTAINDIPFDFIISTNYSLAEAIKIMIAVGILLTYGLQLTVTADLAWQGLRSKLTRSWGGASNHEDEAEDNESSPRLTTYYYGMRFILIFGTSKHDYSTYHITYYVDHRKKYVLAVRR